MSDEPQEHAAEAAPPAEPAAGLYVFYDDAGNIQIGVSGDYGVSEAILMLGAARAKLELIQYHAVRTAQQAEAEKPRLLLPA